MAKDIVLVDTMKMLAGKYRIRRIILSDTNPRVSDRQIDMVILDERSNSYYPFQIDFTSKPRQIYFKDNTYCKGIDAPLLIDGVIEIMYKHYGQRKGNFVLYNGESLIAPNGTFFLNIAEYLKTMDKLRDIEAALKKLCDGLPRKDYEYFRE